MKTPSKQKPARAQMKARGAMRRAAIFPNQRPSQHSNANDPRQAQRNYETYLNLARAETLKGDTVAAENYFQHAEHYFRTMHAGAH